MTSPLPQIKKRGRPKKIKTETKPKKKRGRPKKVKEDKVVIDAVEKMVVEIIEVSPLPSKSPTPPPPPRPKPKRYMSNEEYERRMNYLRRRLTTITTPEEQEKYRNLMLKYERDVEII